MTDHPITPPPGMVNEWVRMLEFLPDKQVFSEVAQWGADMELEACCKWLNEHGYDTTAFLKLRTARRPEPPSLKELALAELAATERCHPADYSTIRKALEALPND